MKIMLSIKPEYVNKILIGDKKWEYRKKIPKFPVSEIIIYSSYPEKKIVAEVEVLDILKLDIPTLWNVTNAEVEGGISKENFIKYFKNKKFGYAYKLGKIELLQGKILKDYGLFFPPESFCYISANPNQKEYKDIYNGVKYKYFSNDEYNEKFIGMYEYLLKELDTEEDIIDALCNYAKTFDIYKNI